jgi:hypothetical protein
MDDQTAIDVYERDKYSEDHREHRDGDAPKGSPIEHDATLTDRWERAVLFVAVAIPAAPLRQTCLVGRARMAERRDGDP